MTNYHLEVQHSGLHGALERFAQFFVAPLFKADAVDREVNAVENEFLGALLHIWSTHVVFVVVRRHCWTHGLDIDFNLLLSILSEDPAIHVVAICIVSGPHISVTGVLQSDSTRIVQLRCATARPGHVFTKFSWGNRRSLLDEPRAAGLDPRGCVVDHYRRHYSAERMSLVVAGGQPLDELQEWVAALFAGVPGGKGQRPTFDNCPQPFEVRTMTDWMDGWQDGWQCMTGVVCFIFLSLFLNSTHGAMECPAIYFLLSPAIHLMRGASVNTAHPCVCPVCSAPSPGRQAVRAASCARRAPADGHLPAAVLVRPLPVQSG